MSEPVVTVAGHETISRGMSTPGALPIDAIMLNDFQSFAAMTPGADDMRCPFHSDKGMFWDELNCHWSCPECDANRSGPRRFVRPNDHLFNLVSVGASMGGLFWMPVPEEQNIGIGRARMRRHAKRQKRIGRFTLAEPRRRTREALRVLKGGGYNDDD
jgi:rubredoxin